MNGIPIDWIPFTKTNRPAEGQEVLVFTPEPEKSSLEGRLLWIDCVDVDWLEKGFFAANKGPVTHWAAMTPEQTLPSVPKAPPVSR